MGIFQKGLHSWAESQSHGVFLRPNRRDDVAFTPDQLSSTCVGLLVQDALSSGSESQLAGWKFEGDEMAKGSGRRGVVDLGLDGMRSWWFIKKARNGGFGMGYPCVHSSSGAVFRKGETYLLMRVGNRLEVHDSGIAVL
jgi:hypothetical protein